MISLMESIEALPDDDSPLAGSVVTDHLPKIHQWVCQGNHGNKHTCCRAECLDRPSVIRSKDEILQTDVFVQWQSGPKVSTIRL